MTSPTLARDAAGNAMLTTEQARALAEWLAQPQRPASLDVAAIIGSSGGETVTLLARWVQRWAPVVEAAERQTDAADAVEAEAWRDDYDADAEDAAGRKWEEAASATEAEVRKAREGGPS